MSSDIDEIMAFNGKINNFQLPATGVAKIMPSNGRQLHKLIYYHLLRGIIKNHNCGLKEVFFSQWQRITNIGNCLTVFVPYYQMPASFGILIHH
jgi:hypothetical protein